MKFSYVMLPDYPLDETIEAIKLADQLGFYGCYAADETWHKDLWLLFAAAADKTKNIRFGPSLSAITLREPTLIAQATATLDELTGGRAECVLGSGNFGLLAQYGIDWAKTKPLSRLKEAHHVVRTMLDDGAITFDGEFFKYSGLFTFARPVQERVPVKLGAMRGPKSFQVAGEFTDGVHHALSYTKRAYEFMVDNVRIGAERAGRDVNSLDLGAWIVFATGPDSRAAKDAARAMVGLYRRAAGTQRRRSGRADRHHRRGGEGRVDRAFELTSPELADRLSVAGTPAECAEKIKTNITSTGVNHLILAITDAALVKAFSGMDLPGVATMREQLQLVHDEVMPAFAGQPA